jgi:glucosamine kinase
VPAGALATRIQQQCGTGREALQQWCAGAGQFEYAQLARATFEAAADDPVAESMLREAAAAIDRMAAALDPHAALPLAIYGSVGRRLVSRMARATRERCVDSPQDAAQGALHLVHQLLEKSP